jgi:micrococcal nuclease
MDGDEVATSHGVAGRWWVAALVTLLMAGGCTVGGGSGPPPEGIPAGSERAVVVRVVDGDTLLLRGDDGGVVPDQETRVRLLEIDTPESVAPDRPVECFGPEASAGLAEVVPPGSRVRVLPDEELTDPYDRLLLYLWTDDGEFVNLAMVRSGLAEAVLYEPNDRYIERMRRAERQAQAEARGMWGAC